MLNQDPVTGLIDDRWAPTENELQAELESIAYDAWEKRSPEFAEWFMQVWSTDNESRLLALVCMAGGQPTERLAAAVISDEILSDWVQYAAELSEYRELAHRRLSDD